MSRVNLMIVGGRGVVKKLEFVGFNKAQARLVRGLAGRGVFFTSSVLLLIRDCRGVGRGRSGASQFLSEHMFADPQALKSADLNRAAARSYERFPARLSKVPADLLDQSFRQNNPTVEYVITRDDEVLLFPEELELKITADITNTELTEMILPILKEHIGKWRAEWEKEHPLTVGYGTSPQRYLEEVLQPALDRAGIESLAVRPTFERAATFQILHRGAVIAVVKKAPLKDGSPW